MSVSTLVRALKDANEDFEFYPTTNEIIGIVCKHLVPLIRGAAYEKITRSLLDVGAGDGRVLMQIKACVERANNGNTTLEVYAIEKSVIHITNMPKAVVVIGTDFMEQTMVDKQFEFVFCNPPYREYEAWAVKLIRELSQSQVYLVIPERWKASRAITDALKYRKATVTTLGRCNFEEGDRKARVKVEVLVISYTRSSPSAFDAAIEAMLPELQKFDKLPESVAAPEPEPEPAPEPAPESQNLLGDMVAEYDKGITDLLAAYSGIVKLDTDLLQELGVTKHSIVEGLRYKLATRKNLYWQKLFHQFTPITKRLATKQRAAFLETLKGKATIDFTEPNIYAMLIWVTKWSNTFCDEQLKDVFLQLSEFCNVVKYKSNQRVWAEKGWRYLRDDPEHTHYKLEYRVVLERSGGICTSQWQHESYNGLDLRAYQYLQDLITVANNLRFECEDSPGNYKWQSNVQHVFKGMDDKELVAVRAFKNGNVHLRFNQKLMLAINVEAGRLLGWIRSPEEAVEEFKATPAEAAIIRDVFNSHFRIAANNILKLGVSNRAM